MKEACRICARELCGNQRRWIFHPAAARKLQVLLSHALGRDLQRDGRGEFACSKCTFMLDRMYRFDTVIARVEALSIERLQRLLQEKERLRQCISTLYNRNNRQEVRAVHMSRLHAAQYSALLQEDLTYSMYESWAEDEEQMLECALIPPCLASEASGRWRGCRGCRALRVADADYEAVCKVPRRVARSISCGPSTRYSGSVCGEEQTATVTSTTLVPERQWTASSSSDTLREQQSSGGSLESLDASPVEEPQRDSEDPPFRLALALLQDCVYKPIQSPRGSRLPVLVNPGIFNGGATLDSPEQGNLFDGVKHMMVEPEPALDLARLEELWQDEFLPFCFRRGPKVKRPLTGQ